MANNLSTPRHLLSIKGLSRQTAASFFELAKRYKLTRKNKTPDSEPLKGQTWGMIFSKSSTRTRVSFEVAISELGGRPMFLSSQDIQLGRGEPISDTASVMGRMIHGMIIRTFSQQDVVDFSIHSGIPTINALTDNEHPCQILTDIFTFEEKRVPIQGRKVVFVGDGACNVAASWIYAAEVFDFDITIACPKGYEPKIQSPKLSVYHNPEKAAEKADLLYTDVWVSMGLEKEREKRLNDFVGFQLNHNLVSVAQRNVLVSHCLPAYRGQEISAELFDERATDLFDQAENRLHVQKGILHALVST